MTAAEQTARPDALIARVLEGGRLARGEAPALWEAPLTQLGAAAQALRMKKVPARTVTYLVDRNINYTNACVTVCKFCAFYRYPGNADVYVRTKDEIGRKIEELLAIGGTRILMQGGHNPDLGLPWHEDLLRWIRASFPTLDIDAFSPSEIDHIARIENLPVETVLARLAEAGLTGLPGGGAEILDDEVRDWISPLKQKTDGWLSVMRGAQALGLATSATMVIGFGETLVHRLNHLERLRRLQDEALSTHGNGFTSFIAWTMQLEHNDLGKAVARRGHKPSGAHTYLKHLALCRLYLDNIAHVSASWPTQGEGVAQVALGFGADDFGSTMMEENVVSASGAMECAKTVEAIRRQIRQAGFEPVQRDTRYRRVEVPRAPAGSTALLHAAGLKI